MDHCHGCFPGKLVFCNWLPLLQEYSKSTYYSSTPTKNCDLSICDCWRKWSTIGYCNKMSLLMFATLILLRSRH